MQLILLLVLLCLNNLKQYSKLSLAFALFWR